MKPCELCGKAFEPRVPTGRFCSLTCRNRYVRSVSTRVNPTFGTKRCLQCHNDYVAMSSHQKYCSKACMAKYKYVQNIEAHRERARVRVRKNRIGLHIRDEHLGQPNKEQKWLWDGQGRWSQKYWPEITECLECNTNVYVHRAYGVCERCYDRLRPRDDEKMKEWKHNSYERAKEKGKLLGLAVGKSWIEKAKANEIPVTPKIENLLDNLERL